jgi:hypothetical protein
MAFTYTWGIERLKKQDDPSLELNDIIVQTYWKCTGTDENDISGTFNGATPFEPDQVDPDNFTSYEDLTEAQVIGWIQAVVNGNPGYKAHIDEQIQKQIDAVVRPITEIESSALPWAPPGANNAPIPPPIANNAPTPPPTPTANT